MIELRKTGLALLLLTGLGACRVELYDELSQRDANEMTALLLQAGVDAERARESDGTFTVLVAEDDFSRAVTLVDESGLPRPSFVSMADVFGAEGLISSPLEERARLNYALSQDLSRTISEIDGVLTARVHLATVVEDRAAGEAPEPSASIAVHHRPGFEADERVAQVKLLVANAVDGLEADRVSVALFRAAGPGEGLSSGGAPSTATPEAAPSRLGPEGWAIVAGSVLVLMLAGAALLRETTAPPSRSET